MAKKSSPQLTYDGKSYSYKIAGEAHVALQDWEVLLADFQVSLERLCPKGQARSPEELYKVVERRLRMLCGAVKAAQTTYRQDLAAAQAATADKSDDVELSGDEVSFGKPLFQEEKK